MNNETQQAASYGEPWPSGRMETRTDYYGNETRVTEIPGVADFWEPHHASRAIQCVNACAGIADPEKAIQAAVKALQYASAESSPYGRELARAALTQLNTTK